MAMKAPFLGKTGTVDVEDAVFGAEMKPHLVHEAVRAEQNALRAGTAATKSRGLVSGGPREAVAPERHRPRAPGHDPRAAVRRRRPRVREDAAHVHAEGEQEGRESRASRSSR